MENKIGAVGQDTMENQIGLTRSRKLREEGGSVVVTIPPELIDLTALDPNTDAELSVTVGEPGIILEPASDEE